MRRKISVVAAGLLVGGALSLGTSAPAHACHVTTTDPVIGWACYQTHGSLPVGQWIQHYYDTVGETVYNVYCKLWDPTC